MGAIPVILLGFVLYLFINFMIAVVSVVYVLFTLRDKNLYQESLIEVDEQGVSEETSCIKVLLYWKGIYRVLKFGSIVIVYMNHFRGIVIPKRAFEGREQQSLLIAHIKERVKEAKSLKQV